jgi:hypothetical protein
MIKLPDGFDAAALFEEFFNLAAPFAGIAFLIGCAFLVNNILKNAPK